MNTEQRKFLDGYLALTAEPVVVGATSGGDDRSQRAFLDGFLALAGVDQPEEPANEEFRRVVIDRWQFIRWRIEGAVSAGFAGLDLDQHRALRLLEDTPSLLHPLGRERDELTHSALLAWSLERTGELGESLRAAFLDALGLEYPTAGWQVRTESVLGPRCRVDVDITVPGIWRCLVEVKVDAGERDPQLDDYRQHLDHHCSMTETDGTLVFLTTDGRPGISEARHKSLSFRELLRRWLLLTDRPEPEARYLRQWLRTLAREFYELVVVGPAPTWAFSTRVRALDFLQSLGESNES